MDAYMWWKKHKWKVIVLLAAVLVLAAAFWYGGDAPELRGWSSGQTEPTPAPQPHVRQDESPKVNSGTQAAAAPEKITDTHAPSAEPEPSPSTEPELPPEITDSETAELPAPVEPESAVISDTAYTCTISIFCGTVLEHMDWLDGEKTPLVPEDGWILQPVEVMFYEGESVFNVLQRTCKQNEIHMEFSNTPIYNSAYIEGIANIYEYDCGDLSGWMYKVNDWFPNYGCSRYALSDGDVVCWEYTCDLGDDIGGYNALGG